ncbi:MAG: TIGR02281 family clan AA aspartic protease [Rhizobiales bacterium]|nr:TIGR02281 family clan AA aspartic protease [Hyphomicrobiales bacterium]MBI3672630.1 TIGR02281 family clan AA aspartic protease [Hyphomicrobiales bacterium]
MRTPFLSPLLVGLLLLMGGARANADDIPTLRLMSATELKANAGGHFITKAAINGNDITVLVDTGATTVALSYEDADQAGLRPSSLDFNVPVATANGMAKAAKVKIDRIEIDGIKVDDVDGLVLPEGALRGTLLGMSFLSRLRSFRVEAGVLYLRD